MEIDLANEIAQRLGVRLSTVVVTTANRLEFLRQGRIDLILATMSDNAARRKVVGVIDPQYYAGGTAIMVRRDAKLRRWEDLQDRRVCGLQGAYYNKLVAERFGAHIVAFAAVPEALLALTNGDCVGFVQDSTLIGSTLISDPKWSDFEMPFPVIEEQPWVMAVRMEDRDTEFGKWMTDLVTEWHRTGRLIEVEKAWGIPPAPFLQTMHQKLKP